MTSMKKLILGMLLLVGPAALAQGDKAFSADTQIKMLKTQRQIQQLQIQIADIQRQFDQAQRNIQALQTEMEAECTAAAKTANVDLTKFSCDLDKLAFVPKVVTPAVPVPAPGADKK